MTVTRRGVTAKPVRETFDHVFLLQILRKPMRGILFLHNGFGDVVMGLPCLDVIRKHSMEFGCKWRIYVGNSISYDLLKTLGYGKDFDLKLWRGSFRNYCDVIASFPRFFLAPHSSGDWRLSTLALISGAKVRAGTIAGAVSKLGFNYGILGYFVLRLHKVHHYLQVLSAAGIDTPEDPQVKIMVDESWLEGAQRKFPELRGVSHWLLCAPGSSEGERHKRWTAEGYIAAAKRFQAEYGGGVIWAGSPNERSILNELHRQVRGCGPSMVLAESDTALVLGVFKHANVMLAPCNGASHLGAAIGLPVVGVFGPTNPANTGPFAPHVYGVRNHRMRCAPCYSKDFRHGCGDPVCMRDLSVEDVWAALVHAMNDDVADEAIWMDASKLRTPTMDPV